MASIDQKLVEIQKQVECLRQESIDQVESILKENRSGLELIRQLNRVGMESIERQIRQLMNTIKISIPNQPIQLQLEEGSGFVYAAPGARDDEHRQLDRVGMESIERQIRQLMNTIKISILNQPIQLQLEEGSGFVDAAPGARDDEHHALQLTKDSELVKDEEYFNPESQYYAYFYGLPGIFRINIPLSRNQDIKIQPIMLDDPSNPLPPGMALFIHHHNHNVYMVGGQGRNKSKYSRSVYLFDPNRFQNLPIRGISNLDKPKELHGSFKPMIHPSWVHCKDRIYFLSVCNYFSCHQAPFNFQSFDLTKNHFEPLASPPYQEGQGTVMGFFSLYDYIYLFLTKVYLCKDHFAYIFDTRSSKWKKQNMDRFHELEIPTPSSCIGDVGLSDKFCDKFQILVVLNAGDPTAYCIQLCDDGSLRPNSYRLLDEIFIHKKYETQDDYAQLIDIGQGRFCVAYQSLEMPLLIYAFKVDFEVEHQIQIYGVNKSNPSSSHLLYSKKFEDPIPLWGMHCISTLCSTSTTNKVSGDMAATSSVHKDVGKKDKSTLCSTSTTSKVIRDMAATSSVHKDVEEKDKSKSSRHGRRRKNSNTRN